MTPFEQWFETKGAAELTRIYLESMLAPVRTESDRKKLVKQVAMTCWNAALEAVEEYCDEGLEHLPSLDRLRATVSR